MIVFMKNNQNSSYNNETIYQLGETADIIINFLNRVLKNYDIENKFVVFSADNAPVNFGTVERTGDKNVLKQLTEQTNAHMIGAGCIAHILHNAIEHACDVLPLDVEYYAVKIYTHFYRYTVRLRTLKEFCESVGEHFVKLKGYSKTRFLALKECLTSIITNFNGLKEYFDSPNAPKKIKAFFNDPFALPSMVFVRDQSENFQNAILKLEGDCVCAVDAANIIDGLKSNIESRLENNYFSVKMRAALAEIETGVAKQKRQFMQSLQSFHKTSLDYLSKWTKWLDDIKVFCWVTLNQKLKWDNVECAALWMTGRNYFDSKDMDKLFDQFTTLQRYVTENQKELDEEKLADKKWVRIFRDFTEKSLPFKELLKLVEFALVIPATNATAERIFSNINDIWTPEKGRMKIENVRARVMVKFNWNDTCLEFYRKIKDDAVFLKKTQSVDKYKMNSVDLFKKSISEPVASTSTSTDTTTDAD